MPRRGLGTKSGCLRSRYVEKRRTKRKTNEDSLIEAVHKVKEGFLRFPFCPLVELQIDALLARFAPPCFGPFRLGSEVVLAPKNDLVVNVVESFI